LTDSERKGDPGYHRNWITLIGALVAFLGFVGGTALFLVEIFAEQAAPYVGMNYLPFMALLVFGFIAIPIGMIRQRRRVASANGDQPTELSLDLSNATHRYAILSFLASFFLVVVLVGVGAYRSYQATESSSFCGELCHSVMAPEWTAYHRSSHARVACVECHIGSGAGWYVRSKLSGLRQIWAVTIDSYPRPIPTPIRDLRPARETCEECHWRRKFIGYKENVRSYFLADEENTRHDLRMLVKIGGEKTAFLKGSGIHYHMMIARKIEYAARDHRRQEIGWIRVTRADGSISEYWNEDYPMDEAELEESEIRTMDCMDCHNRPAHQFPSPATSVNEALAEERIPANLPYIKLEGVKALDVEYDSVEDAMTGIANRVRGFYRRKYPEVVRNRPAELTRAIHELQDIYSNTIFPEMKAKWSAYPNNIGHVESPGCFRCHTDTMVSEEGEGVFTRCSECHMILAQGDSIARVNVNIETGLEFVHPEDFDTIEEYTECTDCHTGGAELYE
jgi:nitrate/TMAO reductase-like tetraheme cytochrome c subunit